MSGPDERRGPDGGERPLDVDAAFAAIVAHFDDGEPARPTVVDDETDGQHDTEDHSDRDDTDGQDDTGQDDTGRADSGLLGGRTAVVGPARPSPPQSQQPRDDQDEDALAERRARAAEAARAARAARIAAEVDRAVDGPDGSHFVPADPPPLPRPHDLAGRLAWTGVLLGPLLLLLCALLWQDQAPAWLVGAIATGIVAAFGYLVWRLPRTRDRDDPGDGAIV